MSCGELLALRQGGVLLNRTPIVRAVYTPLVSAKSNARCENGDDAETAQLAENVWRSCVSGDRQAERGRAQRSGGSSGCQNGQQSQSDSAIAFSWPVRTQSQERSVNGRSGVPPGIATGRLQRHSERGCMTAMRVIGMFTSDSAALLGLGQRQVERQHDRQDEAFGLAVQQDG